MINAKGMISHFKLPKTWTVNVLPINTEQLATIRPHFLVLFVRFTSTLKEKLIVPVFKDRRHRLISVIYEQEYKREDPITSSRVRVCASHKQVDSSGPLVLLHWLHRCAVLIPALHSTHKIFYLRKKGNKIFEQSKLSEVFPLLLLLGLHLLNCSL